MNKIIFFDLTEKYSTLSYDSFFLASYLTSSGYSIEYCDIIQESFYLFYDQCQLLDVLGRLEQELFKESSVKNKVVKCLIRNSIRKLQSAVFTPPLFSRRIYSLLLGAKYQHVPLINLKFFPSTYKITTSFVFL